MNKTRRNSLLLHCNKRKKTDSERSDRRFSTEQEAKLVYETRATSGHRFCGVPTTPRGKDLFLLGLFFG